jgi:hypothetical protein
MSPRRARWPPAAAPHMMAAVARRGFDLCVRVRPANSPVDSTTERCSNRCCRASCAPAPPCTGGDQIQRCRATL